MLTCELCPINTFTTISHTHHLRHAHVHLGVRTERDHQNASMALLFFEGPNQNLLIESSDPVALKASRAQDALALSSRTSNSTSWRQAWSRRRSAKPGSS